jgi:5-dehydro-2-deoxygluconokinase
LTEVTSFNAYVGGCPTNISVGTRRLGLRTALLTAVGDDEVGDFVLRFLDREQVDTRFIPRKAGRRTSAVILSIQPPDRFPLTFYREGCADRELTIADVDRAPLNETAIAVLTGTGLSHEPGRSATRHAAVRARSANARIMVDIDYRPDQWTAPCTFRDQIQGLLAHAHVALGTEEEVRAATHDDLDPDDAATQLLASGLEAVVLKKGANGSTVYMAGGSRIDIPPFPVTVLNVLGAGDAFASGFIYGLRQGWTLARAARAGNAAGAILVTRHGCANFMPTWGDVETFVAAHGGWQCEPAA